MEKTQDILIVAGEASGDAHAAALVAGLKTCATHLRFYGLGGKRMQAEGVVINDDILSLSVIGFFEVLCHLFRLRMIFRRLLEETDRRRPAAAILVDFPGFNLRLARELARRNIPVYYYISPQIWAWGAGRIRQIKRDVSLMLVLFPFEKQLYERAGVPVTFVGHPLLETRTTVQAPADCRNRLGLDSGTPLICLLPGSRSKEVAALLPVMLAACEKLYRQREGRVQFVLLAAPSVPEQLFQRCLAASTLPVRTIAGMDHAAVRASDFALVCSGTATLETAIIGTPMAVLYKVNPLTWLLGKLLIRIPYIGLVNVVAGRKVCEEFIQAACSADRLYGHMRAMLDDPSALQQMREELQEVRRVLGERGEGASHRAAAAIAAAIAAGPRSAADTACLR